MRTHMSTDIERSRAPLREGQPLVATLNTVSHVNAIKLKSTVTKFCTKRIPV